MQDEHRDPAHLWDMLEAASAIVAFTENVTLEAFTAPGKESDMMRLAVERKLEILGEAAHRVSERFRNEHSELPWSEMIGLRNVISHQYDKVDVEQIFRIAREHIPQLAGRLEALVPPPPPVEK